MPVTAAQLLAGAQTQLQSYSKSDPMDQFTAARPLAAWLIKNREDSIFGNGIFNEKVRYTNDSNYQNFQFDDQVSYNTKVTTLVAPFQHYEAHDGFALNETELANNGVVMTDDKTAVASEAEVIQIVSKIKEGRQTLKEGFQQNWDIEVHRDGTQSAKAVPGLDFLISTTPTAAGTIGGIDQVANAWWQNRVSTGIASTAGTLTTQMELMWRQCMTYGGQAPDAIFCGSKFLDAYRNDAPLQVNRQLYLESNKQGFSIDNGSSGILFKGVPLVWDPTFDYLQGLLSPTIPWDKRCYFLNSKSLKLRPFKGRWLIDRKPSRVYDRYTHYFGLTADYGLTVNKRNNQAVLSIA